MNAARVMSQIWSDNVYPLEWICKIYLERASGTLEVEDEGDIQETFTRLQELAPSSPLGPLAEGACLLEQVDRRSDAIAALKKGRKSCSGSPNVHGLVLLARALQVKFSSVLDI